MSKNREEMKSVPDEECPTDGAVIRTCAGHPVRRFSDDILRMSWEVIIMMLSQKILTLS